MTYICSIVSDSSLWPFNSFGLVYFQWISYVCARTLLLGSQVSELALLISLLCHIHLLHCFRLFFVGVQLIRFGIFPMDFICLCPHSAAPVRGLMHIAFVHTDCSSTQHELVRVSSDHETWFSKETACYSAKTQCSFRLRRQSCGPPYADNERRH